MNLEISKNELEIGAQAIGTSWNLVLIMYMEKWLDSKKPERNRKANAFRGKNVYMKKK